MDFDHGRAEQLDGAPRSGLQRRLDGRNQTRYNETSREAVITAIQSVASYVPETESVTFGRQANFRENAILSNQIVADRPPG